MKYATTVRGMQMYLSSLKEKKIRDDAVGVFVIEEAGDEVSDAGGRPLDISMKT